MSGSGEGTPITYPYSILNPYITANSFISIDYFNAMANEVLVPVSSSGQSTDEMRLVNLINAVLRFMEKFCNTLLKARDFSYISTDASYNPKYAIFDPPQGNTFWFPVKPVNSITTFMISDEVITPATDYEGSDGYILYPEKGCLIYTYGFDYGYRRNVKVKWNGGIQINTDDYFELQYIQYLFVKFLFDDDPNNDVIASETLSNYSYKTTDIREYAAYLGIPMFVFNRLLVYRRNYIA